MGRAKRPTKHEGGLDPRPPFFEEEEQDIIEIYEAALERGEVRPNTAAELAQANAEWKAIVEASRARKAVSLRLQVRDRELIKSIARRRGIPYQTLIGSVLHQFAHGALREAN